MSWIIHHNTFRAPEQAVAIRGVPQETCEVYGNWFPRHDGPQIAVRASTGTHVHNNAYGTAPPVVDPQPRRANERVAATRSGNTAESGSRQAPASSPGVR